MKTVNFTEMKNGTKEDYELLEKFEKNFDRQTAERVLNYLSKQTTTLEGYKITRLEHSLQAATRAFKNKKIILIDDSLVRGTTSYKIVKMLYDAGAKEVHVKIACPEIRYPDFYGVDTPTKKELLAANKTNDEICEYIGAKSLRFLSIEGLYRAIGFEKRNETYPQLTDHYFTGEYPVKLVDELGDNKITQLSLLSTGSNN